jgi:hypothetical protein
MREQLTKGLSDKNLGTTICAVCDTFALNPVSKRYHIDHLPPSVLKQMRWTLGLPKHITLPAELQDHYNVTDCFGEEHRSNMYDKFGGLLLSKHSFRLRVLTPDAPAVPSLSICNLCQSSLKPGSNHPPKFSIANGLWIGRAPPIMLAASETEMALLALAAPSARILEYRGGAGSTISGHVVIHCAAPEPNHGMAALLPRPLNPSDRSRVWVVILLGPHTPAQYAAIAKREQIRAPVVDEIYAWLRYQPAFLLIDCKAWAKMKRSASWRRLASSTTTSMHD